jgi:endonuclease/exonuclease/phosphatase family metal-dependent hydrolase
VRVATFNCCHGTSGAETDTDLERMIAACASLEADVLALQEVDRGTWRSGRVDQAAAVAERLGYRGAYGRAACVQGGTMGNALLVRGSLADVEVLPLHGALRLRGRDHRSALLARARVGDLSLTIAVAHLSIGIVDNVGQERRVLDALAGRPGPHLLLGDLNRRTAWVEPGTSARGLRLLDDDEPTAPRTRPRIRIDHIAVAGLATGTATVVDTGASDHRALVVEVGPLGPTGAAAH